MSESPQSSLRFDLQSHSIHSDGALRPECVVQRAADAGVELLALSDHDSISGIDEAVRAGVRHGVRVVPAIELSSIHAAHADLHILGYGIDPRSSDLGDRLTVFQADRDGRADRMLDALRELGFAVEDGPIQARRIAGGSVGRPHVAAAVFNHPANAERLADEGLDTSVRVLQSYLIPGTPAYRGRVTPTVAEAIGAIHAAGGVAVWAHPFWDIDDPSEVIELLDLFRTAGLDGVEVFYPTHTREQVLLLSEACRSSTLLSTGSSDFHGPEHPIFSRFLTHELHGLEPELGPIPEFARDARRGLAAPAQ